MSAAAANILVVYPRTATSTFNKEYYLSTHMPLVEKHWKQHGLKSFAVSELNEDSPYTYMVVMEFDSAEGWGKAAKDPSIKEIMDDVENFSNQKPIIAYGNVIGRQA